MTKEIISDKQGIILVVEFVMGSSFIAGTANIAQRDAWIAIILAMSLSIPFIMMQCRIASIFPEKDFFQVLEFIFGKVFGKVIILLYIWFTIHVAALVLNITGEFINILGLYLTPKILPMICIALLCISALKEGMEVLGRWGELFLPIQICIFLFLVLLGIPQMDFNNIRPILFHGIQPVMKATFSAFEFPFTQVIIFTMIKSSFKTNRSIYKICIIGMLIGGGILLITTFRNIFVMGEDGLRYFFPTEASESMVQIGDFIQRLEIAAVIVYLSTGFIKISICLFAADRGIQKLFNLEEYSFLATPTTLLMLYLSYILYVDTKSTFEWASQIYQYYSFLFQILFPFLIFLLCEFRNYRIKKGRLGGCE